MQPNPDMCSKRELFLWGETPLGCFNEPHSLNQLISDTQSAGVPHQTSEQESEQPNLDVQSVSNGAYFCVFVEKQTGYTF